MVRGAVEPKLLLPDKGANFNFNNSQEEEEEEDDEGNVAPRKGRVSDKLRRRRLLSTCCKLTRRVIFLSLEMSFTCMILISSLATFIKLFGNSRSFTIRESPQFTSHHSLKTRGIALIGKGTNTLLLISVTFNWKDIHETNAYSDFHYKNYERCVTFGDSFFQKPMYLDFSTQIYFFRLVSAPK